MSKINKSIKNHPFKPLVLKIASSRMKVLIKDQRSLLNPYTSQVTTKIYSKSSMKETILQLTSQ